MKTKKKTIMKQIVPLRLPDDIIRRAKAIAEAEMVPYSIILRRAIIEWLRAHDQGPGK